MSRYPSAVFRTRVTRVRRLAPDFLRLSLASPELTGLAAPAGDGAGPVGDAYLKLLIPHPEHVGPVVPDLTAPDWHRAWFAADPRERGGWLRTYTLRAARPWTSPEGRTGVEIDVDVVLHGLPEAPGAAESAESEAGPGPAAAWAGRARPGDELSLIGPTREGALWGVWEPGAARRLLLAGDETAVPAACSLLEDLPAGTAATALLEVPAGNAADLERSLSAGLRADPRRAVRWLERAPGAPRGQALLAALRGQLGLAPAPAARDAQQVLAQRAEAGEVVWGRAETVPEQSTPEPSASEERAQEPLVWLAAESGVVRQARRICVDEAGMDRHRISFMGYWKAGRAES